MDLGAAIAPNKTHQQTHRLGNRYFGGFGCCLSHLLSCLYYGFDMTSNCWVFSLSINRDDGPRMSQPFLPSLLADLSSYSLTVATEKWSRD
eukprot:scaffold421285_cov56-Attheya_sp.AAC.5